MRHGISLKDLVEIQEELVSRKYAATAEVVKAEAALIENVLSQDWSGDDSMRVLTQAVMDARKKLEEVENG